MEPEAVRINGKRKPAKKAKPSKKLALKSATKPAAERSNKKTEVIAMMKRAKSAIATKWQPHTVRGFVSVVGSKGGKTTESCKSAAGERNYRIAK